MHCISSKRQFFRNRKWAVYEGDMFFWYGTSKNASFKIPNCPASLTAIFTFQMAAPSFTAFEYFFLRTNRESKKNQSPFSIFLFSLLVTTKLSVKDFVLSKNCNWWRENFSVKGESKCGKTFIVFIRCYENVENKIYFDQCVESSCAIFYYIFTAGSIYSTLLLNMSKDERYF